VVGASDTTTFEVSLNLSEEKIGNVDPCEKAAEVAAMAIENMT
jgi:hypothetical protein